MLNTPSGAAKVQLFTDRYHETLLSDIDELSYDTYRISPAVAAALPALNLRVDLNGNGGVDTYLTYEPYVQPGAATPGSTWQTWDAISSGSGRWWGSHLNNDVSHPFGKQYFAANGAACGQSAPCTWQSLVDTFPLAQVLEDPDSSINSKLATTNLLHGSLGINQGSGNSGITAAVSMLTVNGTVSDFEPHVTLAGKDECKQGRWATSTQPVFKNHGDCISSFASAKSAGKPLIK